jgi:hypothetical protein
MRVGLLAELREELLLIVLLLRLVGGEALEVLLDGLVLVHHAGIRCAGGLGTTGYSRMLHPAGTMAATGSSHTVAHSIEVLVRARLWGVRVGRLVGAAVVVAAAAGTATSLPATSSVRGSSDHASAVSQRQAIRTCLSLPR